MEIKLDHVCKVRSTKKALRKWGFLWTPKDSGLQGGYNISTMLISRAGVASGELGVGNRRPEFSRTKRY